MNDFYVNNVPKRLILAAYKTLERLWTHPKALQLAERNRKKRSKNKSNEFDGSIADSDDREETPVSDDDGRGDHPEDQLGVTPMSRTWFEEFVKDEAIIKMEHSGKLTLLMEILRIGGKVVVFGPSPDSLELIGKFLEASSVSFTFYLHEVLHFTLCIIFSTPLKQDSTGTWVINQDYFLIDGRSKPKHRKAASDACNDPLNHRARLFLLSTKAGGKRNNFVGANRIIIFNASWNALDDFNCIKRVYG
jgi:transcriptional regulator ATRX